MWKALTILMLFGGAIALAVWVSTSSPWAHACFARGGNHFQWGKCERIIQVGGV